MVIRKGVVGVGIAVPLRELLLARTLMTTKMPSRRVGDTARDAEINIS
jgi:hypothetical protein